MKFYAPGGGGKTDIKQFESVPSPSLFTVQVFVLRHRQWGRLTVCAERVRWNWVNIGCQTGKYSTEKKRKGDTWAGAHLVSGVNLLLPGPHVAFIGATCRRVDPWVWGENPRRAPAPSGALLDTSLTVSTWPTFSHDSCCCFFLPPPFFLSVQRLTRQARATCCNVVDLDSELIMQLRSCTWSQNNVSSSAPSV